MFCPDYLNADEVTPQLQIHEVLSEGCKRILVDRDNRNNSQKQIIEIVKAEEIQNEASSAETANEEKKNKKKGLFSKRSSKEKKPKKEETEEEKKERLAREEKKKKANFVDISTC